MTHNQHSEHLIATVREYLKDTEAYERHERRCYEALNALKGIDEQLEAARTEARNWREGYAPDVREAVVGGYVCENCGRLGPLESFNDDCTPGRTHGRMIVVKSLTSFPASEPERTV